MGKKSQKQPIVTTDDLDELIALLKARAKGEDATLELKSRPIDKDTLVEIIQSGANGDEPLFQIVIGVDEEGNRPGVNFPIGGCKNFDAYRLQISQSFEDNTEPYFEGLEIRQIPFRDDKGDLRCVIVIEVPQSQYSLLRHKKTKQYFKRGDGRKLTMAISEVEEAIYARRARARSQGFEGRKVCDPGLCEGRDELIDREVAAFSKPSDRGRSLLVLGGPGIGKTTFTEKVGAHKDLEERFGDRRWFADLRTAHDADVMRTIIADAVALPRTASLSTVITRLRAEPNLLVLDNLETPWEQDSHGVKLLLRELRAVPNLALLASARSEKTIGGVEDESEWTKVEPLATLSREASLSLFIKTTHIGIPVNDKDLSSLVDRLGGVPLFIHLVASCAHGPETLGQLRRECEKAGVSGLVDLHFAIRPSLRRLHDEGRRLFSLLGALPDGISVTDLGSLMGSTTAALHGMDQLAAVGLAKQHQGRIDLLPPIREYARDNHAPTCFDTVVWRRHYLGLAAKLGSFLNRKWSSKVGERLVPEVANVEAALHAVLGHDLKSAKTAGERLWLLARFSGRGSVATQRHLMGACQAIGDKVGVATCAFCIGDIELYRSKHVAAGKYLEMARKLYHQAGDFRGEAECNCALGETALECSQYNKARKHFDKAVKLYRKAKRARRRNEAKWIVRGEAECIMRRGDVALLHGSNCDEARKRFQQARLLYHRARYKLGEANCIQRLGDVTVAEGGLNEASGDAARKQYDEALRLYRSAGSLFGQANCHKGIADIALAARQYSAAETAYKEAQVLYQRVGNSQREAICVKGLDDVAREKATATGRASGIGTS